MTPEDATPTVMLPAPDPAPDPVPTPPVEPPAPVAVDPLLGQPHDPDPLFTEDMDHQQDVAQQVVAATGPWAIKPQEVVDGHSGLTLTFGNHADDSNTVFLILAHRGHGSLLTFHRNGDLLKCQPLQTHTAAQKNALADAQAREVHNFVVPEPADTEGSAALEKSEGEPWQDNKLAPPSTNVKPSTTPLPGNTLPATPGA